jgi:hypothetical protein
MKRSNKVIITCAVTGSIHTPTMSPHLPITPDEIAEQAIAAAEAGAAMLHLHARDPETGRPNQSPALFQRFLPRIKQSTDAIINITTGGGLGCPALMNTNAASATRDQPGPRQPEQIAYSVPSLARDVPPNVLPPAELAEQIFAAVSARRFQVFPHVRPMSELSSSGSDVGGQGKVPAIWRAAARIGRYEQWHYDFGTPRPVTHLRNSV